MIASGSFNQEIDDIVDAYDGNPAKMEEDVRLSGDMKLTMALQQKVKEIEAQERGATLDTPVPTNTIKDQLADKYYNNNAPSQGETASNVGGVNANIMQKEAMKQPLAANPTANPTSSGIASLNPNLFGGGMARGGIVSFDDGGDVEGNNTISPEEMAEIDASREYQNSLPKSPEELARMLDNLQELIEQSPPEDREQYRPALDALADRLQAAMNTPTDQEAGLQSELDSLVALKEKYPDDPRVEEIFARSKLRNSMEGSPLNPGPRSEERVELPDSRPRERSSPDYIRPPITSETRIPTGNAELAELEAAVSGVNKGRAEDFITEIGAETSESNPIDLERVKAAFTKNKSASEPGIRGLVGDYPTKTIRQPTNNPSGSAEELVNAMPQKEAAYNTAGEPPISVREVEAEMKNPDNEPAINAELTDVEEVVTDPESNITRFDAAMKDSRRLTANDSIDRAFPDEPAADQGLVVAQIKETLEEQAKEYRPQDSNVDKLAAAFPDVVDYAKEGVENSWILKWADENTADAISLGLGALSGIGFAKGATKALWKQLNTAKTREQIAKAARESGKFLQKLYTKPGTGGKIDPNVSALLQDGTKRVFDPTRAAGTGAVISQGIGALVGDGDSKGSADESLTPEQINTQAMSSVAAAFPDEKTGGGIEALTEDDAADDGSDTPTAVTADGVLKGSSSSSKASKDIGDANKAINAVTAVIDGKGEGEDIKVDKDGKPILSAEEKTINAQQDLATDTETFNTDIETEREAQAATVANEVKALEDRLMEQIERRRSKSIIAKMIAFGGAGSFAEGATNAGIRGLAYDKEMDAFENESFAKIRAAKGKIREDKIAGIKERYAGNVALQNLYIGIARTEYDFGIAAENTAFKLAELKLQGIEIRQKDFSNTTMNTYYTGLLNNAITAQSDLRIKTSDANLLAQIDLLANINVKNLGNLMKIKADIDALPSANSTKATTLNAQLEKAIEKFSASTTQIEDLIASNPSAPTSI